MRSFSQFLSEAMKSAAAQEAQQKGLVYSKQKGAWINPKTQEVVARTEKGKLHFVSKRGPKQDDEPSERKSKPEATTKKKRKPQPTPASKTKAVSPEKQKAPQSPPEESKGGGEGEVTGALTVVFGRFNPPTIGHEKLLKAAKTISSGGDLKIYPSRTQDGKKNPLDPDMKVSYMKKMFPDFSDNIINDTEMATIFNVLTAASENGYPSVNIVVGADRQSEFEGLAQKYNGELYNFEEIRVVSAGARDADAEGIEGMSASKMRKAVVDGDFESFRKGTPKSLNDNQTQALFDAVASGLSGKKKKVAEMWEIAPKLDPKTLREKYVREEIFRLGDTVENINTGLVGEIIRRGTNHLICVTKENYMFKSWIRDVMEAIVNYPGPSGVDADSRLVGTDKYREYTMRLTGTLDIKNFINKYKKKSK